MKAKLRAAGYVRVSTAGQAKEGESLSTQRTQIEDYCKHNGLDLVGLYADEGVSGKKADRPELVKLLADAANHKFDIVVVTRLSRYGRSTRDLINNLGVLDDNKIPFISLKEMFDTSSPSGRLLRTMLIAIADFEHETIFTQMKENRNIRWSNGKIHMGQNPFGYRWNKEKKCFEIEPTEAAIYRQIVDWYLSGESYKTICIKLREQGVKAKKAPFSPTTIGGVLKNLAYTGKYVVNRGKSMEEEITVELPALISRVDWERIQAKLAGNKIKTKRTVFPEFWLRNVLICGECGAVIRPKVTGKKLTSVHYYACYWHNASTPFLKAHGRKKCNLPFIPTKDIEDRVMYALLNFLTFGSFTLAGEYVPCEVEALIQPKRFDDQILALQGQVGNLRRMLGRKSTAKATLFEMLEDPDADRTLFTEKIRSLTAEIENFTSQIEFSEQRIAALESERDNTKGFQDFIRGNQGWLKDIGEQILALSPTDKQRLVESMIDGKIIVSLAVEENGVEHWDVDPKFVLNLAMLQALSEEGKLGKVNPW